MEFILQPLTLLTFFPFVGVIVILFMNSESKAAIQAVELGAHVFIVRLTEEE